MILLQYYKTNDIFVKNIFGMQNFNDYNRFPKTWLTEAVLITLFCFPPFGILGMIYASKVEIYMYQNDYEKAVIASNLAKKWVRFGLIAGILLYAILFLLITNQDRIFF